MAIIDFGGTQEEVVMRTEFPMEKARKVLKNETIAVIGYGVQGPGQSLNLKDNGFNVIIGQSKQFMSDWQRAIKDGWKPGVDLFEIGEAVKRGTVIEMLVADAAQRLIWPEVKENLKPGDALYFSHGFSIVYKDQTNIIPPEDVDVIMVAPKGSGTSLRRNFLSGEESMPALRFFKMRLAMPTIVVSPWVSVSGPVICSPPLLKRKSTAIWLANGEC